ncbi:MAG: hypothetical protein F9K22_13495 [Bacteroidetes bacterium]|nr:MAG: hypothetical protein F9K22_13495 [Bacteroidota bacterium]
MLRRRTHTLRIALPALLAVSLLSAQSRPFRPLHPAAPADSDAAALRFERNVNTYLWNADARWRYAGADAFVSLDERFASTLILTPSSSFRDEQNLSLDAAQRVTEQLFAVGALRSFVLSDNQTFGGSRAGSHTAAAGLSWQPDPRFALTPMLGMRFDRQQFENDEGTHYRLLARADSLELDEYHLSFDGRLDQSDLGRRRFKANAAELLVGTGFTAGSSDSVQVRYSLHRNDFSVPADTGVMNTFGVRSNIRARTEEVAGIRNVLSTALGAGVAAELSVGVESRTVDNAYRYKDLTGSVSSIPFNTAMQEFRLEGGLDVRYSAPALSGSFGFHLSERDERHELERIDGVDPAEQEERARQESRLDNTALRSTLRADAGAELSGRNRLSFAGSLSVLQYDTPDSLNTDDRDELLLNLSLRDEHRFSPVFAAAVTAEATLAHTVYLKRDKSANNNWNRIVRLRPEMRYEPSARFRTMNAFEVLANYTVFDFETVIPGVKSYSYRQVAFLDSTSYDITERVGVDLFAHVRVFERGEFSWSSFSERPQQRIEEVTFSPQARFTAEGRWMFAAGFRSFAQKRFRYEGTVRRYESTFLSAGPTAAVSLRLGPASLVEVRGWKEFQRQSGGAIVEYSNMTMNVRYFF